MTTENTQENTQQVPTIQRIASILWPSFITAGIANSFFFTFFDPADLLYAGGYAAISNMAVYSIGFFSFWLVTMSSCLMTSYFLKPCKSVKP